MGSKLIYERRYTSTSNTNEERKTRQSCVKSEAKAAVSASGSYGAASVEASVGYEQAKNKCASNDKDSKFENSEASEVTRTISLGSRPTDLSNWVNADFIPVPIHRVLEKITNLFRKELLTKDHFYGFNEDLDGEKIKEMFIGLVPFYCEFFMSDYVSVDCKPKCKS